MVDVATGSSDDNFYKNCDVDLISLSLHQNVMSQSYIITTAMSHSKSPCILHGFSDSTDPTVP